ncbi:MULTISPECIES: dTDP-glucose 4,6-dehydratase [Streptomyces]|uniref:dTDP-glucose 4,6-dehydratase n=1 Tax=Streptomyces mutomycini TaxID=284036 RepID=A0ABW0BC90_9ACTN|nr:MULTISPECIES: dTDP-glucose 4,6-dehydratase [Streptomyces]KPC81921.1 dTDP-glucose 4,6-dehydratase [Streptomyces sp. NRRL S-4]QRI43522.1 dTDP-glucose 4,6-dehydratase [Streptomyces sp. NRRL S-4]
MRILVTGGAGFIGSHFVRQTLQNSYPELAGAEVTVVDKLTYAGRRENLAPVSESPTLRFVEGDICDTQLMPEVMRGMDLVVHFAAESHVDRSISGAAEFVRTNVLGTQTLLTAALDTGVSKFVHVSTDEVYGSLDADGEPWTEEEPLAPNSPYAASKASADLMVLAFHRTHGLPVCLTRGSNTYGPHQYPEKIVPLFVSRLLTGRKVPLYGDGENIRDWLHVDDHCRGIALVAASGKSGEIYNVGGGTELTNRALTERLLELLGADGSMVEQVADRKGHDRRYAMDISKISHTLGYRPAVEFDEGLAATVDWYRRHHGLWRGAA